MTVSGKFDDFFAADFVVELVETCVRNTVCVTRWVVFRVVASMATGLEVSLGIWTMGVDW